MRADWSTAGFVFVEAGPDTNRPSPARRRAFPLWMGSMKPLLIAGIIVAALGAFVLVRGLSYPSHRSMMRIGDLQATVQQDRAVPQWAGIAAVAAGAIMIGAGLRGRKG